MIGASNLCREEEAVNEAELPPEEFEVRKERVRAMREQVCAHTPFLLVVRFLLEPYHGKFLHLGYTQALSGSFYL